jgi:formiminoglutamase
MASTPLPVILSLPHGGQAIPPEVDGALAIDATTVYNECDLWVDQLYDFARPELAALTPAGYDPGVLAVVQMPVARVLVDANRDPAALDDPDGPVKTQTSYGEPIYRTPPAGELRRQLLARYWQPYHDELDAAIRRHAGQCKLLLDCHNMAQVGPTAYGDPGAARPLICLANLGDSHGQSKGDGQPVTCPPTLLQAAGELAKAEFSGLHVLEPLGAAPPVVRLNSPFAGGYILRRLVALEPALPVIMIEVNRGLFVGQQGSRTPPAPPRLAEIVEVRRRLYRWTVRLLKLL